MTWQKNGTPDTLGSTGDTLSISDLTAKTFNQILSHELTTGIINTNYQLAGVTATDYARRRSRNGAADSTLTSQTNMAYGNGDASDHFNIDHIINISGEEKLLIGFGVEGNTVGAGNAPHKVEMVGKMDTTTDSGQFTQVDIDNSDTGGYIIDSNLSALGTD